MKHCNDHIKLLNNIKEIQQRKEKHIWTQIDKIETDCVWIILEKVGPTFVANRLDKDRVCLESSCCDLTRIISIKEFFITIFEF